MQPMNNLKRIASADQNIRRNELMTILREMGCPFTHHLENIEDYWPENIIVSFSGQTPRLVIGAHYDSVPGSTGANDNGAGVCVMLEMIHTYLQTPPNLAIDLCFFDLEEIYSARGSATYIERVRPENILAMINLDVCGVGDTLLVGPRNHAEKGPLSNPIQNTINSGKHQIQVTDLMPPGDDRTFERFGIPNISAGILPRNEIDQVIEFAQISQTRRPETYPPIIETMHNGPRDNIDVIEEEAMQRVLKWALDVVEQF